MKTHADKIHHEYPHMPRIFLSGSWTFLGPGDDETLYETFSFEQKGKMELRSRTYEAGLCRERSPSLLVHGPSFIKGTLKSKGGG